MWAVIKKEFKTYFLSPVGYVFIGLFLLIMSVSFYEEVIMYGLTNFEYVFSTWETILAFIALIPILTMRIFSEERKTGTEQLLLTSPLSITRTVLAKFISAVMVIFITEVCSLMYFGIICYFGMPEIPTALVAMLGFLLLSMSYISLGILASSITEHQIIAGVLTIITFLLLWFLPNIFEVLSSISLINLFTKFLYGQIDIADTVTYIAFTAGCLLLTIIVLQRRKSIR